jgi:hypothetical protein
MKATPVENSSTSYGHLSLKDLLDARDLYHVHLMKHANVVATAVARYRIRKTDSWPNSRGQIGKRGRGERTLENAEVRPYSWPCILVFVKEWVEPSKFNTGGDYDPDQMVPKTLYLPDGRRVPVCVITAPRELSISTAAPAVRYPLNNLGGGFPILAAVQGQEHVATIACLVSDGHKVYALTNRHVAGEPGEILFSRPGGKLERIGVSSPKQLTRLPFAELYPTFTGQNVFVNLDVGLIDVDDVNRWTAQIRDLGTMGPMVDLSATNLSLSLIGRSVRGYGSASGVMLGEIHALFYRYKSQGGFEYVSDFFIGPHEQRGAKPSKFVTHPGDSGTLWLLECEQPRTEKRGATALLEFQPLALQWGAHLLHAGEEMKPQTFALATCLSTVCNLLNIDPIRDWNIDQPDTWGAVGHFSIASRAAKTVATQSPKLSKLMTSHRELITHDDATILTGEFKGMGSAEFVPLADVPDFYWKHGLQGFKRGSEGPNHFADMDQKRTVDQVDLLKLCANPATVDPKIWDDFYSSVTDVLTGEKISQTHRGLLPFRVWQIFDGMVEFAMAGKTAEFVCAAGVLTHYIGDACQPLHISYLHDGDPERAVNGKSFGAGVHAAYEDQMVSANRAAILTGLNRTQKVTATQLIGNGQEAAVRTVALMRSTFKRIPPADLVQAYVQSGTGRARTEFLWNKFGKATIACMRDGTRLIGTLWASAWQAGDGDGNLDSNFKLTPKKAMAICGARDFLPSCTIAKIAPLLKRPAP